MLTRSRASRLSRVIPALLALLASSALTRAALPGETAIEQLDRAEMLIAEQDAAGRSAFAMLGVLTDTDRAALTSAITEAAELTDAASVSIDEAVDTIDAMAGPGDGLADRRFALAIERRELRLPLARARAAVILAALQNDARTRTALATTAVNALHKVTLHGVAINTRGAVIAGEAMLLLGDPDRARASFNSAIRRADDAKENDRPAPMDLAEAMIGRALAIGATDGDPAARVALSGSHTRPPFVVDGAQNPLLSLLRADASVRLDLRADPGNIVIDGYLAAIRSAASDNERLVVRAAVFDRLDRLWRDEYWTPATAPVLATIVRAHRLGADEATRTTAIRTLERLLVGSRELNAVELTEARFTLASVIAASDPRRAMGLLLEIAGDPDSSLPAWFALRSAYKIGDEHDNTDLDDPVTAIFDRTLVLMIDRAPTPVQREALLLKRAVLLESVGAEAQAVDAYSRIAPGWKSGPRAHRRAVSLATERFIKAPSRDTAAALLERVERESDGPWDESMRELLAGSRILALIGLDRLDDAVESIEGLPSSPPGSGALSALAIDRALDPLRGRVLDAERRDDPAAQLDSANLLLRVTESDRARNGDPTRRVRSASGFGLLFAGRPQEALPVFQYLLEERYDFRLNTWRGEAFHALNRPVAAFPLFRSVTETLEGMGQTDDPDYWRCWSRMLEILAARDEQERNKEAIRVQINRLRLIDPDLGGEPHRRRIEAVERAIKPTGE